MVLGFTSLQNMAVGAPTGAYRGDRHGRSRAGRERMAQGASGGSVRGLLTGLGAADWSDQSVVDARYILNPLLRGARRYGLVWWVRRKGGGRAAPGLG